jgi:hypothetical protein
LQCRSYKLATFSYAFPPPAAQKFLPLQIHFGQDILVGQIDQLLQSDIDGDEGEGKTRSHGDPILLLRAQTLCHGRLHIQARMNRGKAAGRSPSAAKSATASFSSKMEDEGSRQPSSKKE